MNLCECKQFTKIGVFFQVAASVHDRSADAARFGPVLHQSSMSILVPDSGTGADNEPPPLADEPVAGAGHVRTPRKVKGVKNANQNHQYSNLMNDGRVLTPNGKPKLKRDRNGNGRLLFNADGSPKMVKVLQLYCRTVERHRIVEHRDAFEVTKDEHCNASIQVRPRQCRRRASARSVCFVTDCDTCVDCRSDYHPRGPGR